MGLDAQAKRFFLLLLGALIAVAAYFQAAGVGQLIGATVAQGGVKPSNGRTTAAPPPIATPGKNAGPILARNAFDSVTGPLDGTKVDPAGAAPIAIKNGNDPYQDPPCSGVKVSLITASDDPSWSFAALSGSDGKSQLRRQGDTVGSAQVVHIGWFPHAPEPSPHVWLNDAGTRCVVTSGALEAKKAEKPKDAAAPPDKKLMPPEISDKIHKISDTQFTVERSAIPQIIQNYAQLAAGLRTRPTKDGVRLSGIKPNTVLGTLGLKNGDILKTINGYDMADQDKALEAYAKLKTASKLSIVVDRGGSPTTLDIGIQ